MVSREGDYGEYNIVLIVREIFSQLQVKKTRESPSPGEMSTVGPQLPGLVSACLTVGVSYTRKGPNSLNPLFSSHKGDPPSGDQ